MRVIQKQFARRDTSIILKMPNLFVRNKDSIIKKNDDPETNIFSVSKNSNILFMPSANLSITNQAGVNVLSISTIMSATSVH